MTKVFDDEQMVKILKDMSIDERQEVIEMINALNREPALIDAQKLRKAMTLTLPGVEKNGVRPDLQCLHFDAKDGVLTVAAANGFELVTSEFKADVAEGNWFIHHKDADELRKNLRGVKTLEMFRGTDSSITFSFSVKDEEKVVVIGYSDSYIASHSLNWQNLQNLRDLYVAESYKTEATFEAEDLRRALAEVKSNGSKPTELFMKETSIEIAKMDPDSDKKKKTVIKARVKGEARLQGFEWKRIMRIAGTLSGDITLKTNGTPNPALFEQNGTQWVIMPMFIEGKDKM